MKYVKYGFKYLLNSVKLVCEYLYFYNLHDKQSYLIEFLQRTLEELIEIIVNKRKVFCGKENL